MAYKFGQWSWGYQPAMTQKHRAYWGARAIWNGKGDMDLLPDRQSSVATDEGAAERLRALLNGGALKAANKRLEALARTWEVSPSESNEVILHEDDKVRIVANTNGSYGYLYVTAQLLEEA